MLFLTSLSNLCANRFSSSMFRRFLIFTNISNYSSSSSENTTRSIDSSPRVGFRVSNDIDEKPSSVTIESINLDHNTVKETISSYGNDWKRALEFWNWVEKECGFVHSLETYNQLIDVLGKYFEFDLAWDTIERMQNDLCVSPDHVTFRIMFKRYAAAHLVQEAIDTYNRTEEFNLKDDVSFSNLIDALCENKHVIEAAELCMGKDSKFRTDTKMYNMILRGWLKMGWWSKCREFWEEMERKGVAHDLHSYSIYMDILCKSGKPWKAIKLYKEMKKKGILLDVVAYNTVLHAMGLSEGVDMSLRLYREMLDLGCRPSIVTYNMIIKLLCQSGRVRQAYGFLKQMSDAGCAPNAITYHCFFGYLTRPRELLALFERMIESGCRPRMETYVMLLRKFGRWGFLRPVFHVWDTMKEHGYSPDEFAYNALIDALVQKGMIEMAWQYDNEMLAKGLSPKPRKELGTKRLDGELDYDCR